MSNRSHAIYHLTLASSLFGGHRLQRAGSLVIWARFFGDWHAPIEAAKVAIEYGVDELCSLASTFLDCSLVPWKPFVEEF